MRQPWLHFFYSDAMACVAVEHLWLVPSLWQILDTRFTVVAESNKNVVDSESRHLSNSRKTHPPIHPLIYLPTPSLACSLVHSLTH